LVKTSEGIEKLVEKLNGFPVIAKLTRGSQGKGIMIADSLNALNGIIDTISLLGEDLIIQEYFETEQNADLKKLVSETMKMPKSMICSKTMKN